MSVRLFITLLLSCLALASGALSAQESVTPTQIKVVSEAWADYTNADGSGLGWDLLREVFEPAGVKLQVETVPYTRAVGLVQRGQADAWVGAYRDEVGEALFPRWHYDLDPVYSLGLASIRSPSLETLGVYRLIWLRGYDYQDQFPGAKTYQEVQRRDLVPEMLLSGRADFYIDAKPQIDQILAAVADPARYQATHLADLPLYLGFAPNERGRALMALFDQRMALLVRSGKLRPIFQRWKEPYPFDKPLRKVHGAP